MPFLGIYFFNNAIADGLLSDGNDFPKFTGRADVDMLSKAVAVRASHTSDVYSLGWINKPS